MLLVLTIVLVLIAAVTLLIGIFSDSLALIYVSIAASFGAAAVLALLSYTTRRRQRSGAPQAPAAAPATAAAPAPRPSPAPVVRDEEPTLVAAAAATGAGARSSSGGRFPIEDYESLRVGEILPRLERLDLDELEQVAQREEEGKNRVTILNRIDELMDELEAEEAPAGAAFPSASTSDLAEVESGDEDAPEIESIPRVDADQGGAELPIPNYDSLRVSEILPLLDDLDADELETVAEYEERRQNRISVLNRIDDRLDELEGIAPAPQPAKKTAAKKTTKKGAAKKRSATPARATTKKTAATAKKTTAKKTAATAKKTAVKKATATKAAKTAKTAKKATKATKRSGR